MLAVLAPVKNLENAQAAIQAGADEIYLASPSFGARVNASLDLEEIKKIVDYAHNYKVKVFLTFNTIILEVELPDFFRQLDAVYKMGIDAVIVQDYAIIEMIKRNYSDLEIHASTQMNINNVLSTKLVQGLGANRVVVPREMNFERIRKIKDETGVEIEAFVHGALCVSYSGQCYDSTLLDQKSANRGKCSQYCRMPQYIMSRKLDKVVSRGRYPLNLKDLNNIKNLDKYKESGVDSLKIEGRLKQIDYAYLTTKMYRKEVDKLISDRALNSVNNDDSIGFLDIAENDASFEGLKKVYNRTFTEGRINDLNGKNLVNLERPNNTGEYLGKIISVGKNEKKDYYQNIVELEIKEELNKNDVLRFVFSDGAELGQRVEQFEGAGNRTILYSNLNIIMEDEDIKVYRVQNKKLISRAERIANTFERKMIIPLTLNVVDGKVYVNMFDRYTGEEYAWEEEYSLEIAVAKAFDEEMLLESLNKNNTPFQMEIISFYTDEKYFYPLSLLKKLRKEIINKFLNKKDRRGSLIDPLDVDKSRCTVGNDLVTEVKEEVGGQLNAQNTYFVEVRTQEQYNYFIEKIRNGETRANIKILLEYEFAKDLHESVDKPSNIDLKGVSTDTLIYDNIIVLPRIMYDDEYDTKFINKFRGVMVSELGGLSIPNKAQEVYTNFTMNTTNTINQKFLLDHGVDKTMISIELNKNMLKLLNGESSLVNIYGRIPVMIMDYCPINMNKKKDCGKCRLCRAGDYYLKDELEREFPLIYEGNYRLGLYSKDPLNLVGKINELKDYSINNFHLRMTNEENEELDKVYNTFFQGNNQIKENLGNYNKQEL